LRTARRSRPRCERGPALRARSRGSGPHRASDAWPRRLTGCRLLRHNPLDVAAPESGDVVPFEQLQGRVLRDGREVLVDREEFVAADQGARSDETVDP